MTKKIKTVEELLEKIDIGKLKSVGVNETNIAKVEALHDALRRGKTWDDEEVRLLFGVLPDSFPFCASYVNTEILVKIGKAKPIKVIARPGIKDSRLRWIPIEKADEFNAPASLPIQGYEIICSRCLKVFIGKEAFHQNYCGSCAGRKVKDSTAQTPKPVEPEISKPSTMIEPIVSFHEKADKPKRRGRPVKSTKDIKSAKQTTKRPFRKATKKGESKKRKK